MLKQWGESYDPNYQYKRFNYRSNVDIDITKSTLLKVNIGAAAEEEATTEDAADPAAQFEGLKANEAYEFPISNVLRLNLRKNSGSLLSRSQTKK